MTPSIDTTEYRLMLKQLGAMHGDVMGFTDASSELRLQIEDDLHTYRQQLHQAGRKDRLVIKTENETIHVDPKAASEVIQLNKVHGYSFNNLFDIAICDGVVFVSRLEHNSVRVHRYEDQTTYLAYRKFFIGLWLSSTPSSDPNTPVENLTIGELKALLAPHNIASAHNLHRVSSRQEHIVDSLPTLWRSIHHTQQAEVEKRFLEEFFSFRRASHALNSGKKYINYSASVTTGLVANFLRSQSLDVSLISPCVDLIPSLLKDAGVLPSAIDESLLHNPSLLYENFVKTVHSDVIFLVNPNNPTGFCLDEFGEKGYRELARFCRDYNKLLIIDMCFMPFISRDPSFTHVDCYKIFKEYDIDYITVEDSGKFLPTMDMKAAILHVSKRLIPRFDHLHSALILRHSPFIIKVMTAFIQDAAASDIQDTDHLIRNNLSYMKSRFELYPLRVIRRQANVSIAWVQINSTAISAKQLQQAARTVNIELLTGETFFWDNPSGGKHFFRVALARDEDIFRETIDHLMDAFRKTFSETK